MADIRVNEWDDDDVGESWREGHGDDEFDDAETEEDSPDDYDDETETVACPACGNEVYEFADYCPSCGQAVRLTGRPVPRKTLWIAGLLVFLMLLATLICFGCYSSEVQSGIL